MASFVYNKAAQKLLTMTLDIEDSTTFYVHLVDTTSTAGATPDAAVWSDFTTSGIYNHASYDATFGGTYILTATGRTITAITGAAGGAYVDATDRVFTAISPNGSVQVAGAVIYDTAAGTTAADVQPIAYYDFTDFLPTGSDITIAWGSQGICKITTPQT